MAFPVVAGVTEGGLTAAGTSVAVTLPASGVSTDEYIIIMDIGSTSATLNALTGWTELLDEAVANGLKIVRYTGAGVPSNPTFVTSASTRTVWIAYRISGANKSITPQIGTTSTGTSATPDPPASAAPPSTKDYLFIAFAGMAGEEADDDTWGNTPPTNYTPSPPRQVSGGISGTNIGGLLLSAERQLNTGAAENPGTFGVDVSAAWRAQTITVHPSPAQQITITQAAEQDTPQVLSFALGGAESGVPIGVNTIGIRGVQQFPEPLAEFYPQGFSAGTEVGDGNVGTGTIGIRSLTKFRSLTPALGWSQARPLSYAIAGEHFRTLTTVTEVDEAQVLSVSHPTSVTLTPVTETDKALIQTQFRAAQETDSAQALSVTKTIFKTLTVATETDRALIQVQFRLAAETDTAQVLSVTKAIVKTLTLASETDSALVQIQFRLAQETDSAQALSVTKTIFKSLTPATETDLAGIQTQFRPVAETDSAQPLSVGQGASVVASNGLATATGTAPTLTIVLAVVSGGGPSLTVTADLVGWYKADALGLADGDPVTSWTDSSGNGNTATGGSPTLQTNEVNGLPIVRFDGNDSFALADMSSFTAATGFMVFKRASATGAVWDTGSSGSDNHHPFTDQNIYDDFGTTVRKGPTSSVGGLTDNFYVYDVVSAASDWRAYLDATNILTTGTNTVGLSATPLLGKSTASNFFIGDIAEVLVYDAALSDVDREAVEDYLTEKYFGVGGAGAAATASGGTVNFTQGVTVVAANGTATAVGGTASLTLTHVAAAGVATTEGTVTFTPTWTATGGVASTAGAVTLTFTYLASAGTATAGGGSVNASQDTGLSATNGTATATGGTANVRFIYTANAGIATAAGGTVNFVKSKELSAVAGTATATGGVTSLTFVYLLSGGVSTAGGGSVFASVGTPPVNNPPLGGIFDEAITGGVFDNTTTNGTVTTYIRGGTVVTPVRGGAVTEPSRGGVVDEPSLDGEFC